jgi:hypothetical protein
MATPEFDALVAAVTQVEGTEASAAAAIVGLANLYAAAKNDPVAIQALSDRLLASDNPLQTAVAANPLPA